MARKRKDKSLAEAAGGLIMMIVALAILSPVFRGQVISTLSMMLAIVFLFGTVGLFVYLITHLLKKEEVPVRSPVRNSVSHQVFRNTKAVETQVRENSQPARPDFGYSAQEEARIQEIIQSLQPTTHAHDQSPQYGNWDETVLPAIEWKRFETVTKEYLKMTGYVAHETNIGADGGVDIRVARPGTEGIAGIVQCKAWNTYKVGVKPVRELFGVMAAEKVSHGMVITSGSFTGEAEDFAKGRIKLVSGARFLELIRKLPEEKQRKLLEVALEGDYQTPTCPQCDLKMALRENKKGRNVGGQFWGCVNYPRCRQTLVYKH